LSDVYAMGGVPKTAMNLVGFPLEQMDMSILREILQGGIDKMKEAGVVLVGGHSVEDPELKYGLSVTGFIHPKRILTKKNLKGGDQLILTKPLGTGIVNTAIKGGIASPEVVESVTHLMARLNRKPAEIMSRYEVHACTDITGFGLLGHLAEMVLDSGCAIRLKSDRIPIIPEAREYAQMGFIPAGAYRNREFRAGMTEFGLSVDRFLQDLLFDPQTSGGLLISVSEKESADLLRELKTGGVHDAVIIGDVMSTSEERIFVQ